jgi:hypothetical protein
MNRLHEIAKFFSGFEAFHAIAHLVFLITGTTFVVFGSTLGPTWNLVGVIVNAAISLALAVYGWNLYAPISSGRRFSSRSTMARPR